MFYFKKSKSVCFFCIISLIASSVYSEPQGQRVEAFESKPEMNQNRRAMQGSPSTAMERSSRTMQAGDIQGLKDGGTLTTRPNNFGGDTQIIANSQGVVTDIRLATGDGPMFAAQLRVDGAWNLQYQTSNGVVVSQLSQTAPDTYAVTNSDGSSMSFTFTADGQLNGASVNGEPLPPEEVSSLQNLQETSDSELTRGKIVGAAVLLVTIMVCVGVIAGYIPIGTVHNNRTYS